MKQKKSPGGKLATLLGNLTQPHGEMSPLPESFLFGVGSADHQVEAYDPLYQDIRDVWEQRLQQTLRGRATEFWDRYPEDIQLAQSLGCKLFRLSIAWSRVEPTPGHYNDEAFNKYLEILKAIQAAGMEPMVTLHHFTWPLHVEEEGGTVAEDFPQRFERYATEVATRLGQGVRYWLTFNEPTMLLYGYLKPWWVEEYFVPPGMPPGLSPVEQMEIIGRFIRNLFVAHTAARAAIRRVSPEAKVGVNPALLGIPAWLQKWVDGNVTRLHRHEDWVKRERMIEPTLLERGKVDIVVATLTTSPERAEQVAFSDVYFVASQALLVQADSSLHTMLDLHGKPVAAVKSSTAERTLRSRHLAAKALIVSDYTAALEALEAGKVEAILSDDTILMGLMQQRPGRYRLLEERLTNEPYAAAVVKGDSVWLDTVNEGIRQFRESGQFGESYARFFPNRPIPEFPSQHRAMLANMQKIRPLTPQVAPQSKTLERIRRRGYLIAAVKANVPGFGYYDTQSKEWSGIEIELTRAIARAIFGDANRVQFVPAKTRQRIPLLRSFTRLLDPLVKQYSILTTILTSNWWHLGMAGKLPEFLCPASCVGQQDYVGIDYYWGLSSLELHRIQRLFTAASTSQYGQATVWPGALYDILNYHAQLLPEQEILIVENGCVDVADGMDRATYLREHIKQVQRARQDGINVIGYICWCITSNREWGAPFNPSSDFGLYHIDLDTDPDLKRIPTVAAEAYRQIIAKRGA